MTNKTGYLIGSFAGSEWRDLYIKELPKINWNDPRNHEQSSIKRLNEDDFGKNGARGSDFSIAHKRLGKSLGTVSFAEIATARTYGKPIIISDSNENEDKILFEVASYYFNSDEQTMNLLNKKGEILSGYGPLKQKENNSTNYKNILFTGNLDSADLINTINLAGRNSNIRVEQKLSQLENFSKETDLIVVNFRNGWDELAVFYLGLGKSLGIPTIIIEENKIPYPPLTGLAKKVFFGKNRLGNVLDFLDNPKNFSFNGLNLQNLNYYKKMAAENSYDLNQESKTSTKKPCENIYFGGDLNSIEDLIKSNNGKNVQSFGMNEKTDLYIINFDKNKNLNPQGLRDLCYAYVTKTPVLLIDGNEVLHQEIAELSRRPLIGPDRFEQAKFYLKNLGSQHIGEEANLYYKLMERFK